MIKNRLNSASEYYEQEELTQVQSILCYNNLTSDIDDR